IQPGREEPGIESYGFSKRCDRLLILPERPGGAAQTVERGRFSRIRIRPGSSKLVSLVPCLSGIAVVTPRDHVPFAFTHAVPQFESPPRPLRRECRLPGVGVRTGKLRHRERKMWVELNGPFQVWNRLEALVIDSAFIDRERVRVERFERGRRGLRQRHVVPLDRRERLAELSPQSRCGSPQRRQYLFFAL